MNFAQKIAPCLWFDTQAEEAANLYVSIFKNSEITHIARYPNAGSEIHGKPADSVMTVAFTLDGQPLVALNGGPHFKFNEAISLQLYCDNQQEVDHFWQALSQGGDPNAQQCGWLKDKFGLSWQVVPKRLLEIIAGPDTARAERAMNVMMKMKKLVIRDLESA